jgi:hypothetical protein
MFITRMHSHGGPSMIRVRFACLCLPVVALMGAAPPASCQAPARPFEPVGRWRFFHDNGAPFTARLAPDQSAATDSEGGEHGIWRWEGGNVRVIYTDGWDDLLSRGPDGKFVKRGWGPDNDRCGPASNQTAAERLSPDPGPPL